MYVNSRIWPHREIYIAYEKKLILLGDQPCEFDNHKTSNEPSVFRFMPREQQYWILTLSDTLARTIFERTAQWPTKWDSLSLTWCRYNAIDIFYCLIAKGNLAILSGVVLPGIRN